MPKKENSDDDNLASNSSSDQNDSDSDSEQVVKSKSSKKRVKQDSDSNESEKAEASSSDESSDEEREKDEENVKKMVKKVKSKATVQSSDDEAKSDNDGSPKSDDSDKEKSNKSNDEKSDKSDDNKSEKSDDDDEDFFSTKKRAKKMMSSDSDSDSDQNERDEKRIKKEQTNDDMEDIFGEMSDEEEDLNESKRSIKSKDDPLDSDQETKKNLNKENDENERIRDIFQQFEDEDDEQQPETETRIDVTIPKIVVDLGKESHFVKLPNFLSVDTHPYDPSWYEDEIDEDEILDDEGRARMKLKVENTIRWRNTVDKDGNMTKESNARIVKWSDGSMSLHLGSEIFDIHKQHLLQGDNNHLYIRQGTGLQGQSVFKTKLTFRPHSTDSFTHKKMTLSLADRSQKTQKIRVLPTVGLDPEANRVDRIKKEEDKLRASLRRENKARRVRERVNQRGPTASYLEPDVEDEEGAISLSAIKNKYKQKGSSYADVYSDSESSASSNDSIFKKKAATVKKPGRIEESDDED